MFLILFKNITTIIYDSFYTVCKTLNLNWESVKSIVLTIQAWKY